MRTARGDSPGCLSEEQTNSIRHMCLAKRAEAQKTSCAYVRLVYYINLLSISFLQGDRDEKADRETVVSFFELVKE